jgi:hypothetical protein
MIFVSEGHGYAVVGVQVTTLAFRILRTNNPCLPAGREVKEFSDCLRYAKMELMRDPIGDKIISWTSQESH